MTAQRDIPSNSAQPLFAFYFARPGASGIALIDGNVVQTFKNEQRLSIRAHVFAGDHQFVLHLDGPAEKPLCPVTTISNIAGRDKRRHHDGMSSSCRISGEITLSKSCARGARSPRTISIPALPLSVAAFCGAKKCNPCLRKVLWGQGEWPVALQDTPDSSREGISTRRVGCAGVRTTVPGIPSALRSAKPIRWRIR